jgi:hypothetical protein
MLGDGLTRRPTRTRPPALTLGLRGLLLACYSAQTFSTPTNTAPLVPTGTPPVLKKHPTPKNFFVCSIKIYL